MQKNLVITGAIAVAIVIAGASFWGGMIYGKSQNNRPGFNGGNSAISIRGNRQNVGLNSGEIISKDDKSITIKLVSGGSKIIFFSASTEIGKFVSGALSDLEVGKNVMVQGQSNSDGSITAQSIQIRPATNPAQAPAPAQ
jgi:hypothetical protein